jgi:hypothetical protein
LGWLKKFGPAQIILGPVKGHGIRVNFHHHFSNSRTETKELIEAKMPDGLSFSHFVKSKISPNMFVVFL